MQKKKTKTPKQPIWSDHPHQLQKRAVTTTTTTEHRETKQHTQIQIHIQREIKWSWNCATVKANVVRTIVKATSCLFLTLALTLALSTFQRAAAHNILETFFAQRTSEQRVHACVCVCLSIAFAFGHRERVRAWMCVFACKGLKSNEKNETKAAK